MGLFWLGFFVLVALLLVLDLGVLHRKQKQPTMRSSIGWTIFWVSIGLSFAGVVYLIYENNWNGVVLTGCPPGHHDGADATITYVSAYLLEQALSVDNLFVIALVFKKFKIPLQYQHRVLFWGILGAIGFRVVMLGGGAFLTQRLSWVFYVFGAYLVYQGIGLLRGGEEEEEDPTKSWAVKRIRRFVRIEEADYGGAFSVRIDGRRAFTMVALCLVTVELTDIVFAMDSIPAVLSVSQETFIMITSNIFAILGLRTMYFVLAGALVQFEYLKFALGVLLAGIGAKMLLHSYYNIPHWISLLGIAAILAVGVLASVIATKRNPPAPEEDPGSSLG